MTKTTSSSDTAQFLHDNPPEDVGATLNDDEQIQACLNATVEYYHENLPDTIASLITERWGITRDTIRDVNIGYVDGTNDLISHLQKQGFSPQTILRAGVATDGVLKHVYSCDPSDCRHNFPTLDEIARLREHGEIQPRDIDLEAVITWADTNDQLWMRDWWDNRIVFPYQDGDGAYRYLIARRTNRTDDRPGKYIKQTVKKPWVNDNVVSEPLYGAYTVANKKPLIITEGITDAIMAHQHGYRAITPATTQVKHDDLSKLVQFASQADPVYIVNDNDTADTGLKGAVTMAAHLDVNDIESHIVELPRGNNDAIDLAAFLRDANPESLNEHFDTAVRATEHPKYEEYAPTETADTNQTNTGVKVAETRGHIESRIEDTDDMDSSYGSAVFTLSLNDVCEISAGYRGDNPLGHVGVSHSNYFSVFKEATSNGPRLRAYDHKTDYGYNALTWLACECGVRPTDSPGGSLSRRETWAVWKYAKEQQLIPHDDPIPAKAILHVADEYNIVSPSDIPESDDGRLDETDYDKTLTFIDDDLGIPPGRPTITN
ncbi:toprim domain-containing protein [Salinibaculum rarum]|uniref:toprim domain-containing protein n=1 Tax=Salinibaculum rarum TaxID=3058903 RepID=UPI00265F8E11|nr:toprim domain-containing protein [Salinibaculum sp. KK48]